MRAPESAGAVAVIGNSITDGYGLTPDLQNRWTDVLSEALLANPGTREAAVLNLGIGATTVLGEVPTAGVQRSSGTCWSSRGCAGPSSTTG